MMDLVLIDVFMGDSGGKAIHIDAVRKCKWVFRLSVQYLVAAFFSEYACNGFCNIQIS